MRASSAHERAVVDVTLASTGVAGATLDVLLVSPEGVRVVEEQAIAPPSDAPEESFRFEGSGGAAGAYVLSLSLDEGGSRFYGSVKFTAAGSGRSSQSGKA